MNTTVPVPEPFASPARARFALGHAVRHVGGELRGVVIDADPAFPGDPEITGKLSPHQTFYKVLVSSPDGDFIACVAETFLEIDPAARALRADEAARWFSFDASGHCTPRDQALH